MYCVDCTVSFARDRLRLHREFCIVPGIARAIAILDAGRRRDSASRRIGAIDRLCCLQVILHQRLPLLYDTLSASRRPAAAPQRRALAGDDMVIPRTRGADML